MKKLRIEDLENLNVEEFAKFWVDFESEVGKDDGAAQEHLDAGRAIYYSKNGREIVKEWPDGRCEIVELQSTSSKEAVAILAVDNVKLSSFGYDVLKRVEDGLISYEQAKEEILSRARSKVSDIDQGQETNPAQEQADSMSLLFKRALQSLQMMETDYEFRKRISDRIS